LEENSRIFGTIELLNLKIQMADESKNKRSEQSFSVGTILSNKKSRIAQELASEIGRVKRL
jgi:hypothetical protein